MTLNIGGVEVGGSNPCRFVFEVSNAHNGDFDRAIRLIDAAKECGAEFVKFQAYLPSELVALRGDGPAPEPWGSQGWTMERLYEKAQTPLAWLPDLFQHARNIGIVAFSSVFGLESLAACERSACPAYKVARFESENEGLVELIQSRGKPMFVSTDKVWGQYREWRATNYLYCPKGYPVPVSEMRLPYFRYQGQLIGLSSHCMDSTVPLVAVARGCKLIEMHGQLDDEKSELEANVSLTASEFRAMIEDVRRVEVMLG